MHLISSPYTKNVSEDNEKGAYLKLVFIYTPNESTS